MSERRPKKRPNVFANVVANADEVVAASFIASGPGPGSREAVSKGADAVPAAAPAQQLAAGRPAPDQGEASGPVSAPAPAVAPAVAAAAPAVVEEHVAGPGPATEAVAAAPVSEVPAPPVRQFPATRTELAPQPLPVAAVRAVTDPRPDPPSPADSPAAPPVTAPAPVPEAVAASAVEAEPKVAPRRRPPAAVRRSGGQTPWSHQAVLESFASATIQSRSWKLHGFRIVPEILTLLKDRINADRRSSGNPKLAISHYLDAVLRHTPTDVDEQIALAQDFLTVRMGIVEAGKQSTYRVGPQASAWVTGMNVGLQEADYGRKGIYVVSASVESFLRELDGGGPLQRPELPGR